MQYPVTETETETFARVQNFRNSSVVVNVPTLSILSKLVATKTVLLPTFFKMCYFVFNRKKTMYTALGQYENE